MKIFITGFQRSGTTLTRRLIHNHPEVKFIAHELRLMKYCKSKEKVYELLEKNGFEAKEEENWGEKVPWSHEDLRIIYFCERWNEMFSKEKPRIIHVIRNPVSVGISNVNFGWCEDIDFSIKVWKSTVYPVLEYMDYIKNGMTFVYEDLLLNPRIVLKEIFSFCGLKHNKQIINKICKLDKNQLIEFKSIEKSRAFSYVPENKFGKYDHLLQTYKQTIDKYLIGNIDWV